MTNVEPRHVQRFKEYLLALTPVVILRKADLPTLPWLEAALDTAHVINPRIPDAQTLIHGTSTTIYPFVLLADGLSPAEELVTLAHEFQHVQQFKHGSGLVPAGWALFWIYLLEGEARAALEAEAYAAGFEVQYLCTGRLPTRADLDWPFERGYALTEAEERFGAKLLETKLTALAAGIVHQPAAKLFLDWARSQAPELLARR